VGILGEQLLIVFKISSHCFLLKIMIIFSHTLARNLRWFAAPLNKTRVNI
jgi:hypothetical protein